MKEFLKRFPVFEAYFRPFYPSTSDVSSVATPVNTENLGRQQTSNQFSTPSNSTSVAIRSLDPSVKDEDHGFFEGQPSLTPHFRPQLPLSPYIPPTSSTFPLSYGLLSYYNPSQHLTHLTDGLFYQPKMTLSVTSFSNTALVVDLAKNLTVSPLINTPNSTPVKEDALDSWNSQVFLPPSSVKPAYLSHDQFIELCVCAAFLNLMKNGAPLADLVLLQHLLRGWPGKNIDNLQYLAGRINLLKSPVDFRGNIPSHQLDLMSPQDIVKLGNVSLSRDASLIHEMLAMTIINRQQESQMSFLGEIRKPNDIIFSSPWFYNNSGNPCPDYKLQLNQIVGQYTHMGVDFKFTKRSRGNYDVIRGYSADLEKETEKAHRELARNVSRVYKNENINPNDRDMAIKFSVNLDENRANFANTKNLDNYIWNYNGLGETYRDFLIRNRIGVNLIAPISIDHIIVDPKIKEAFSTSFKHFYLSENSSLLAHLNKTAQTQNVSLISTKGIISDYANNLFSDFS